MFQPIIKWSGSKRSQANEIISYFPKEIDTYYEPFCGSCSILRQLIDSSINVNKYICSDINDDLISLWQTIKNDPQILSESYNEIWHEFNRDDNMNTKKQYYYDIRKRFNETKLPVYFIFLTRTAINGLIRYNSKGEFNSGCNIVRKGINPKTFDKILYDWNNILNKYNVQFRCCSYETIKPKENDFVYIDPPYMQIKKNTMYNGTIDFEEFWNWLRLLPCGYALSFDGISGNKNNTYDVPKDLYSEHKYILSGNSPFKQMHRKSNDLSVYESLYIK